MNLFFGQILNGIATGMLYALMGLGLSLITGILNIPNFAHGALFAVGAYLWRQCDQRDRQFLDRTAGRSAGRGAPRVW